MNRRRFLGTAAGACSLLGLSACAGVRVFPAAVEAGRLRLPAAELAAAFGEDDVVLVRAATLTEAIYLVRVEGQISGAIGATCTHLGCQVRPGRASFRCPCHGSTFGLDGQVVRGPAPQALTRYSVNVTEDHLEIVLP